ncbi:MAG: hypothetical protein SGBAC_008388 [Bacillariaceae sp.]
MSLHLSILRRSDVERPKGIHKRARTSSTEMLDEEDEQQELIVLKPLGQQHQEPMNWSDLIVSQKPPETKQDDMIEKLRCASFSSTESTTLSEDEMCSLHSLIEATEGFESGFDTFDDYLKYSSSNLEEEEEESMVGDKLKKKKSKSKLKRKMKKLKTKLKTSFQVKKHIKRIHKNSAPILRAITNATALVLRGALFLTVNVLIVLTIILSLAIV